jgi:hypothetical protein
LRVYYLIGDVANFTTADFDGLENIVGWGALNRQVILLHGASRKDFKEALRNPYTEFIFWIGHGNQFCTLDCNHEQIRAHDFDGIGPRLRGMLFVSCYQIDFYEKIRARLRKKDKAIPSLWCLGDTSTSRELSTRETRSLFGFWNIRRFHEMSVREEPCQNLLEAPKDRADTSAELPPAEPSTVPAGETDPEPLDAPLKDRSE